MGAAFYYVNCNLQFCILRNLLLTGRLPPTDLRDSKIIDWKNEFKRNWTLSFFCNFFLYHGKLAIVLQISCASIFLRNFKVKWPPHTSYFGPWSCFRIGSSNAIWVLIAFWKRMLLFFWGRIQWRPLYILSWSSANDAPIIFSYHAIILLDVLETGF